MEQERDILRVACESSPLHCRSIEFSRDVRRLVRQTIPGQAVERRPLDQLYRSGSSVGANIRESKFAETPKDFLHKLKVAEKELAEFFYWLGLLSSSPDIFDSETATTCVNAGSEIQKLLASIIVSTKRKHNL